MHIVHHLPATIDGNHTIVVWSYDTTAPWSVRVVIRATPVVVRHISRDLLRDSQWAPRGNGFIRAFSTGPDTGDMALQLEQQTPRGGAHLLVLFERGPYIDALRDIYCVVPNGTESKNMDWARGMRHIVEGAA